jgi:ABC-type antimicrobial peptide transport system permease subunit
MEANLYLSAQSHYAGDIVAMGYDPELGINHHLRRNEMDAILAAAEDAGLDTEKTAVRTTLMGMREGTIFFNGNAASLKYVVGLDWQREAAYFNKLSFTEPPAPAEDNSIFISAPIARELGARRGDSIILEVLTAEGQKNTGPFIIAGIVEDENFFSYYKVYVSRLTLNRLIGFADEDCSLIGFYVKGRAGIEAKREALYNELFPRIDTGPLVYDRTAYDDETRKVETGIRTFLVTLPVYLSEVSQLMEAIDLASYVLYGMMLAIIMVSAGVTCRLILHERTRETGTMRAIGFYESDVRSIFTLEIFILAFFSLSAGFVFALFFNELLSYASFSWFPGFEIFMQNGKLAALYLPKTLVYNILAVLLILALAIRGPIFRNSRSPLPEMLSGGVL